MMEAAIRRAVVLKVRLGAESGMAAFSQLERIADIAQSVAPLAPSMLWLQSKAPLFPRGTAQNGRL